MTVTVQAQLIVKNNIGNSQELLWHYDYQAINWLNLNSDKIVTIFGTGGSIGAPLYVEDLTRPFVIYREGAEPLYFWMRLDWVNPQEPLGGDLTADEALNAVISAIRNIDNTNCPVDNPTQFTRNE